MAVINIILGAVFISISSAVKLPDFIHTCKQSDPKYHECLLENGPKTVPGIIKGDASIKLPKFTPYKIEHVMLDTNNLKMEFDNLEVYGIETAQMQDAMFDFKNNKMFCRVLFPKLDIKSHYNMDGQILIMRLTGNGNADIRFENVVSDFNMVFDIRKEDSKEYMQEKESTMNYTTNKVMFKFENLIPGSADISKEINGFMNENWQIINEEISPAVAEVFRSVVLVIVNSFVKVPMDELFPK